MTDYTPTTERVRADYIHGVGGTTWYEGKAAAIGEVFDRWLAEIKAGVWQEGIEAFDKAITKDMDDPWSELEDNPYLHGEQE